MSAVCVASSVLVPGVSTTLTSRSQGVGTSTVTTLFPLLPPPSPPMADGWRSTVIASVVGSTPTRQNGPDSSAFSSELFPALNSPTVQMRKTEVDSASRKTAECSSSAPMSTSVRSNDCSTKR